MNKKSTHWADITADKIIREKGDKEIYTLASGITPSGFVHYGNFREAITVYLVAKALKQKGKNTRVIHSWDNFDTFRKVPGNIENKEEFKEYLYRPIVDIPDPFGKKESYAASFIDLFEKELSILGMETEFLYQAEKYRASEYKENILTVLKSTQKIKDILNKYRNSDLSDSWLPISIYCKQNNTDQIKEMSWDNQFKISYTHESGHQDVIDLNNDEDIKFVKLPWRIDWPMRWAYENVDFEPGGKDHSSDGGSFTTAKLIVKDVFNQNAPTYLQYDFVSLKGQGGKMSSSKGNIVTVSELLKIYEPIILKWIYASHRPNVDFSIGFDDDVIKTYESFDRLERIVFKVDPSNEKKYENAKRVYELSQIGENLPLEMPFQPSFRHLTNIIQVNNFNKEKVQEYYKDQINNKQDLFRLNNRIECAINWLNNYAPDEFTFNINTEKVKIELTDSETLFFKELKDTLKSTDLNLDNDKNLHEKLYEIIHKFELEPKNIFTLIYNKIISRDKGPRLASFINTIGKETVSKLL